MTIDSVEKFMSEMLAAIMTCQTFLIIILLYLWISEKNKGEKPLLNQQNDLVHQTKSSELKRDVAAEKSYRKPHSNTNSKDQPIKSSSQNPLDAIANANLETDPEKRRMLYNAIAEEWAKVDPQACFDWVMSLNSPRDKSSALVKTILAVVRNDNIDLAVALIEKTPRGEFKDDAVVFAFRGIAHSDLNRAIDLAKYLSGEGAIRSVAADLAFVFSQQSRFDEMAEFWEKMPDGSFKEKFGASLVHNLCKDSLMLALNWVLDNSEYYAIDDSLKRIAGEFVKKDPAAAIESADLIDDLKIRNNYIQKLGLVWGREDPGSSGRWLIDKIGDDGYFRNKTIGDGIIAEWVQWDHEKAFTALETIQNPTDQTQAQLAAIQALSSFDPAAAATKLLPLLSPDSVDSQRAIAGVASIWLQRDPLAASQWIGLLDVGPLKDASIGSLVSNILSKDKNYEMAGSWAAQISSAEKRAATLAIIQNQKLANSP
jgi:hypothetical protein